MALEAGFAMVPVAALTALLLSVGIERLMTPRPSLARPPSAWLLHAGLLLCAHALLTLLLGRPWFAAAALLALLLTVVLVNNAKVRTLDEPFVFQDYEYFTDAVRHPRLYIPFLGWWKFLGAAAGVVLAVAVGLWWEAAPVSRFAWSGQLGGVALVFVVGALSLVIGARKPLAVTFDAARDVREFGLIASMWRYAMEERAPAVESHSPFVVSREPVERSNHERETPDLPHLVAVQSESFFDARALYAGIRADVLAEFDRLCADALLSGKLSVPAWGANTVRSEFAFLSGIGEAQLGVHRFNPYRAVAAGWEAPSLAASLRRLGYRTVCIHPYPASFYRRDRVYPKLGFDEFVDIRAFDTAARFGPYIGDAAVADKVASLLENATQPVFVFVITMENHGPLHLEHVAPTDIDALYREAPPAGCEDLTIYLRHLRNADRMIGTLRSALEQSARPASLCWFGDHVPIMPAVYDNFGKPKGEVHYVCWSNRHSAAGEHSDLAAHDLAIAWLRVLGLVVNPEDSDQSLDFETTSRRAQAG
ncbi:MAG TPA: LTA synthase family protein [Burkholderiales bacterium]|nr:LTA synthase family protein [Burkholderiales bacterium]